MINSTTISSVEISKRILKTLNVIDRIIAKRCQSEPYGLLSGSGGCSLYFMHRYFQNSEASSLSYSLEILEKEIIETNRKGLENYSNIGYSSSSFCWLIDQYVKLNVLDESEKFNSSQSFKLIVGSFTKEEFKSNQHDLFYGFVGKAIIAMEHDQKLAWHIVLRIIKALQHNAIKSSDGIHWKTPYPFFGTSRYEQTINLGIPHGSCGIILFLLKCCDVYNINDELTPLLKRSIDWIINQLEKENNRLPYSYSTKPSGTGKLGWCYGDQAIAFTLLRYSETFNCDKAKAKAYELIEQAASKPLKQAGVQYYPQYGYYDMRLCHGTSSVAYMWQKMYLITKDENIKSLANKWLNITLDNLEVFLPHLDKITELEKGNDMIDTSMGFLNGLSGVGLALTSFLEPTLSDWDKLLLLDRPGKILAGPHK